MTPIKPLVIALSSIFDPDTIDSGVKVQEVTKEDLKMVESSSKTRVNVIQITTVNHVMMWDIEFNEEVLCVEGYSQFCSSVNYVKTGLQFYMPNLKKGKTSNIQLMKKITKNKNGSIFVIPGDGSKSYYPTVFNLFCELDLHELRETHNFINNGLVVHQIDINTALSNVHGFTLFTEFCNEPSVPEMIRNQLKKENLESYTNDRGIEYDHIKLRRMYYTLIHPYLHFKDRTISVPMKEHRFAELAEQIDRNILFGQIDLTPR